MSVVFGRKKFMIVPALLTFAMLLISGCGNKLREGEVCGKEFREAYTTTRLMPLTISNGKTTTTTLIPYIVRYPDRWSVTIKAYNEDNREWETATYWVAKEVFDAVNIGEQFEYDAETCLDDEPYTRERKAD